MKTTLFLLCLIICECSVAQVSLRESERHMAVIDKGQKLFISENDFVNGKIYEVTTKSDTVEVIGASAGFFKFYRKGKGQTTLMALTKKLEVEKLFTISAVYEYSFPFEHKVFCPVQDYLVFGFDSADITSTKSLIENLTNVTIVGEAKDFFIAETDYSKVFIHKSNVFPPEPNHLVRTALKIKNDPVNPTIGKKTDAKQSNTQSPEGSQSSVSQSSSSGPSSGGTHSVQCSGTTKKGSRCMNMTTNSSGRCHLH